MKIFLLVCLAAGLASSEKLDRTYLPPPGSKFSGGSPGDIQVPLEYPKENFSTNQPGYRDEEPKLELGINRRPSPTRPPQGSTQRPGGFTYFQNSYSVPKTTTSYAITQTTTFAPVDDYEGLDQGSGFLNTSTVKETSGLPKYPQRPGQTYQQQQPIRGQPGLQGQNYNQYQQEQNRPSSLAPYGSTTLRPQFSNYQNKGYLPPVPSKGQLPSNLSPTGQSNFGYQSGRPQGPKYQDGQQFSPISKPGFIEATQQTQFIGNPNIPSTTTISPYQDGASGTTPGLFVNQQKFGAPISTPNQNQFTGNFPSSTPSTQYQNEKRITPGQQTFGSRIPNKNYMRNQNLPSSTTGPQYQDEQRTDSNQNLSSTGVPQYQDSQRFSTPGANQETFVTNQQRFGSQGPSQQNRNQYGNQNFPSSTMAPQIQNGQFITTPSSAQQEFGSRFPVQQNKNQFPGSQKFSPSTSPPQYQNVQSFTLPGNTQQQSNQYQNNQNFPSTTGAPQYQDRQRFTTPGSVFSQKNQDQYLGNQNYPTSTAAPQYENEPIITTPGFIQQNQYTRNKNIPSTITPQFQNSNEFITPSNEQKFLTRLPNQQYYPSSQAVTQNGNQQYPSTAAPQYQGTLAPIPGNNQQVFNPNQQDVKKYAGQTNYDQRFPSSTTVPQGSTSSSQVINNNAQVPNQAIYNQQFPSSTATPQGFVPGPQSQFNNDDVRTAPKYPGQIDYSQRFPSSTTAPQGFVPESQPQFNINGIQTVPSDSSVPGNQQPSVQTGSSVYGIGSPSTSGYPNQGFPSSTAGPKQQPSIQADSSVYGTGSPSTPGYPNQGFPTSTAGPNQQLSTDTGSSVYGIGSPSTPGYPNQGFPSSTAGPLVTDFPSRYGAETASQRRPERPQAASDRTAEILNYENILTPEGYSYTYDTSNGIHADETGTVGNGTRAQGGYSYTGDDGKVYSVFYSADENGFQPRGDHLPTPPPIPEAIQRVIEQANRDKESGISDDGTYDEDKYGHMKYDGALNRFKPKNKTISLVNGADIPERYENRFGEQRNITKKPETNDKSDYPDEDMNEGYVDNNGEKQLDDEGLNYNENNRYSSNKRPMKNKSLADGKNRKSRPDQSSLKMNVNTKPNAFNKLGLNGESDFYDDSGKYTMDENERSDDLSETDVEENVDDKDQDFKEESDLINYKDDPKTRTDFRGLNKYLPKPTKSNRLNESDNQRQSGRFDGTKKPVVNKSRKPEINKEQGSEDTVIFDEQDSDQEDRIRIPSRKNKVVQKNKNQLKPGQADINDEPGSYDDKQSIVNEEYKLDDETKSPEAVSNKQRYQTGKNKVGKPNRVTTLNGRTGVPINKNMKTLVDENTGYEYTPPEKKFDSEGAIKFPSRMSVTDKPNVVAQKGIQTTLRPFMTPNVYGDSEEPLEEENEQYDPQRKLYRPERPFTRANQTNTAMKQENRYTANTTPQNQILDGTRKTPEQYDTTSSRRPFERPQTTPMPDYGNQYQTDEDRYNQVNDKRITSRPNNEVTISNKVPANGGNIENNGFVSTTPYPYSDTKTFQGYQRPGQYQSTLKPANDFTYYDETGTPIKSNSVNRPSSIPPGTVTIKGQVPSTTYRPQYVFGDKTPSSPITVDGYGRPITSTNVPVYDETYRSENPANQNTRYPSVSIENKKMEGKFRPGVGRFGVTSTQGTPSSYQGTSPAFVQGEDFSGPKQPQRFDPETGYYYK